MKPEMKIYIIYIKLTRWAGIVEEKTPTEGRACQKDLDSTAGWGGFGYNFRRIGEKFLKLFLFRRIVLHCADFCNTTMRNSSDICPFPLNLSPTAPSSHPSRLSRVLRVSPWIYSNVPLAAYFTYGNAHISVPHALSCPTLSFHHWVHKVSFLHLCLYSCLANGFISNIFQIPYHVMMIFIFSF